MKYDPSEVDLLTAELARLDDHFERKAAIAMIARRSGLRPRTISIALREFEWQQRPEKWARKVQRFANAEAKPNLFNVLLPLREDPAWQGVFGFDELAKRVKVMAKPPWMKAELEWDGEWRNLSDIDVLRATEWVQRTGFSVGKGTVRKAITIVAHENSVRPVPATERCSAEGADDHRRRQ